MDEMRQQQEQMRARAIKEAGTTYSALSVFLILFSFFGLLVAQLIAGEEAQQEDWYRYLTYLMPQLGAIGAIIFYFVQSKKPFQSVYSGCKWQYFFIALLMQFGLMFSLSYLNNGFVWILEQMGYSQQGMSLPALDGWNLLPAIIVIAALPAFLEETVFRGIISRNLHRAGWGTWVTVLISGALFSLYHGNPEQTIYQFICGACFTLITLRAGSILPTMAAHFMNNALILILSAVYLPIYGASWELTDIMPLGGFIALCIVSGLAFIGTLVYEVFFDKNNTQRGKTRMGKVFVISACVGLIIFSVEWIVTLVSGFING